MSINDPYNVVPIITGIAEKYGVNPLLAIATAIHESGLNPKAIGDNGTSFGLYQLHEGGELGNMTPQQAYDPTTNATVAISHMAAVMKAQPNLQGGALAAAAQRPANQTAYASAINKIISSLGSTVQIAGGGIGTSGSASSNNDANEVTDAATAYAKAESSGASNSIEHSLISGGLRTLPIVGGPLGMVASYFTGGGSVEKLLTEMPKVLTDAFSFEEDLLWPFADNHMLRLMLGLCGSIMIITGVVLIIVEAA